MRFVINTTLVVLFSIASLAAAEVTTTPDGQLRLTASMGHSHNDYYQRQPLTLALDAEMLSIEADVFVRGDELFVAHDEHEIRSHRTLRRLYLDPLYTRFEQRGGKQTDAPFGGSVRPSGTPIVLMVDFKSEGSTTWPVLEQQLAQYPGMIRHVATHTDGSVSITPGPVIVAVSGKRPIEMMTNAVGRYSGIDGRFPDDLNSNRPAHLMPMVSCSFSTLSRKAGGNRVDNLRPVLNRFARATAEQGRLARVWGTPDNQSTWRLMRDARMQLINTDQPDKMKSFLE
ncbi:PI-PLC domain-containing protein [Mucisphaera calidilacus]|uniref:Altered inheritance of mitochondria protein 6 n=1 Tax=Mucisphaera calidilacus TaxID=2527982 RepID=A0A518BU84_9BACT|nr:hypothetical protein [Mucisphaera calidilacus]QDU70530.1 hypothetical protein Pan265_03580 [Mucisphaera calidilacus]